MRMWLNDLGMPVPTAQAKKKTRVTLCKRQTRAQGFIVLLDLACSNLADAPGARPATALWCPGARCAEFSSLRDVFEC